MNDSLRNLVDDVWYGRHPARLALMPLTWIYRGVTALRRAVYDSRLLTVYRAPVPVIVVGNITVGGTGKTPLVIWLARKLKEYGFKPGIVARGYRGAARSWPQQVRADSDAVVVGDEALLLARRTGLPVAVGPQRSADIALGVPFNIASYALLMAMVAQECKLTPRYFVHTLGDAHIYVNHVDGLKRQLEREPKQLPTLQLADKPLFDLKFEDIALVNYQHDPFIKFEVAV